MRRNIGYKYNRRASSSNQGMKYSMAHSLPKAGLSAATYVGFSSLVFPQDMGRMVSLGGVRVPFWAVLAGVGAVSSLGGDIVKPYVYNYLPSGNKIIKKSGSEFVDYVVSGSIATGILASMFIPAGNIPKVFMFSLLQNGLNEYLYKEILSM